MIYVAKYVLTEEYVCPHCHKTPPDFNIMHPGEPYQTLFDSFALSRDRWGAPLNITSGYRCPLHNSFIGGRPLSAHQFGLAFDVYVGPDKVDLLYQIIDEVAPDLRIFKYDEHIHIDTAWSITPRASDAWEKGWRG